MTSPHDRPGPSAGPQPTDPPDSHLALGGPAEAEIRIQRSRFIGICLPADDPEAARESIAAVGRRFHDARHACWAWRLGPPPAVVENRNDDGEPSGTAGEPILQEIRKRELTSAVVVVVRYFGGIKLGTGGLARAYGQAAAAALELAPIRTVRQGRLFRLRFPYAQQKTLRRLIDGSDGEVRDEIYTEEVAWLVWLPHSRWRECAAAIREATAGSVALADADDLADP